jgi:hypothetical protein
LKNPERSLSKIRRAVRVCDLNFKLGIAGDFFSGQPPLNGLRPPPDLAAYGDSGDVRFDEQLLNN